VGLTVRWGRAEDWKKKMIKIFTRQASKDNHMKRKTSAQNEDERVRACRSASAFENILFHLNALKNSQEMFDQFMEVVEGDVKNKITCLKSLKNNDFLNANQKTYAAVQIFMLKRYSKRIKSFQKASEISIGNICDKYCKDNRDDEQVGHLVNKHIQVLAKMKRRMKQIIDVSEKYAVIELFIAMNALSEQIDDLDLSRRLKDSKDRRLTESVTSFSNVAQSDVDSPSLSRIPSPSSSCSFEFVESSISPFDYKPTAFGKKTLRPLKSLSDHIFVLTKTFTNKH